MLHIAFASAALERSYGSWNGAGSVRSAGGAAGPEASMDAGLTVDAGQPPNVPSGRTSAAEDGRVAPPMDLAETDDRNPEARFPVYLRRRGGTVT